MRPHRSRRPSLWFLTVLKPETQVLIVTSKPSGIWPLPAPSLHLRLILLTLSHFTLATFAFVLLFEYSCLKAFALIYCADCLFPSPKYEFLEEIDFFLNFIHCLKQHLTHFVEWLIEWISWWSFWPGRYIHTAFPKHLCSPHMFLIKVH